MKRWLLVAFVVLLGGGGFIAACASRGHGSREPLHVPVAYKDVRTSAGHQKHLDKVGCVECHGTKGFAPPSQDVCEKCHAKTQPLHKVNPLAEKPAPRCVECHAFGANRDIQPWNCIRCHAEDQNTFHAVGAHAGEKCSECHQPHQAPGTKSRTCTECHDDRQTKHAGMHGCLDCHDVHETKRPGLDGMTKSAAAGCERCHAQQKGNLHVDEHAYNAGHTACTTCHAPHDFKPKLCAECHTKNQTQSLPKHTCLSCHQQHDGGAPKTCTSCHQQTVAHPNATKSALGSCMGCHPPHAERLATVAMNAPLGQKGIAASCNSCHAEKNPHAGKAACLDCHDKHGGKPQIACASCHTKETKLTVNTGHQDCKTCHKSDIHGQQEKLGSCQTCHAAEATTAGRGHTDCSNCHQVHAPKPQKTCASCHEDKAKLGHGTRLDCTTCHRPHGPNGPARPPACTTCHTPEQRKGLHAVAKHQDCASCHNSHEVKPRDDRATCIACHNKQKDHQPTATRCSSCHPFR